jgi:hypothetical protein
MASRVWPPDLPDLSLSDWLGVLQVAGTVTATFFAWRAVVVASKSHREAAREKRLARLERVRAVVGEMERLQRFGGPTDEKERVQEQLTTLLPSLGGVESLPGIAKAAHWHSTLEGAEDVLEEARLEADRAILDCLGHD